MGHTGPEGTCGVMEGSEVPLFTMAFPMLTETFGTAQDIPEHPITLLSLSEHSMTFQNISESCRISQNTSQYYRTSGSFPECTAVFLNFPEPSNYGKIRGPWLQVKKDAFMPRPYLPLGFHTDSLGGTGSNIFSG